MTYECIKKDTNHNLKTRVTRQTSGCSLRFSTWGLHRVLHSYCCMTSRSTVPRNPKHKNSVPTVRDKIRRKRTVDVSPSFENFVVKIQTVKNFAKEHRHEKRTTTAEDSQRRHTFFNHAVGSIRQVQFGWRCLPTQTAN